MFFNTSELIESLKKYDFSFFAISIVIFIIGILNLYSATHASDSMGGLYKMQLLWFLIALVVGGAVSFVSSKNLYRFSYLFFLFMTMLLFVVLLMGHQGMGATRWIALGPFRFQPSEMMKVALVLGLARWFARRAPDLPLGIKDLIIPLFFTGIPVILIALGPDLGTSSLVILVFFIIAFYRNLRWKSLMILAVLGVLSAGAIYQFGLKEYQRNRISSFLDPSADARGTGYNAIQSKIAVGSGKIFGKGFKNSSQASLNYLPENHTDFVFSIFNEEHGFVGSLLLIFLYLLLLFRYIWLASTVNRLFESIVVVGLMSILFLHISINMAMVTGLMPIVGLPLPFMSYGGSSLLTFFICNGIATSLSNSRNLF